jgi:hypothetical protein
MRLGNYLVGVMILTALFGTGANAASAGNNSGNQRGGKAAEHMSTKGSVKTNAQWSADPERGWVRADERHKQPEKGSAASDSKKKGKGK